MNRREIAEKLVEKLNEFGAGLGTYSVNIIDDCLKECGVGVACADWTPDHKQIKTIEESIKGQKAKEVIIDECRRDRP